MSIEFASSREEELLTNGIVDEFEFDFLLQDASHLVVYQIDVETREPTLLVRDTDYTVEFDPTEEGGSITTTNVLATGVSILMLRVVPLKQETVLNNDGGALPKVHEATFDYLMSAIQQLEERLDRTFCTPVTEGVTGGGIIIENFTGETVEGLPGDDGAGYGGTSASSLAIASSGSKAFVTQEGLAYVVGSRIRAASAAAPTVDWMEGIVTAYATNTLTVTMDLSAGSGTHTDWNLSIAGARGSVGPAGPTGVTLTGYTGHIINPENDTIGLDLYTLGAGTIDFIKTILSGGTATVKLKINGSDVTGSSHGATTSIGTGTCTAANTFAVGDHIEMVISSVSSAADLEWSVKVSLTP